MTKITSLATQVEGEGERVVCAGTRIHIVANVAMVR